MSEAVLRDEAVRLGQAAASKQEAIQACGEALVATGLVEPAYIEGMFVREEQISTYMGEGFAIPHGTNQCRVNVLQPVIGYLQFPQGVDWDGHQVTVCIPIASGSDAHMGILSALAGVLSDPENAERLRTTSDPAEVHRILSTVRA
ncbi:PTS sugar transporter subunit IIA [Nigerium massiliense]|uniref:PTS sugar transporter subunit IIA n=1 Tax=Nigerium massiliense TaxID=1522317 RepID=UPI00058D2690|nr:PTS sugar transporter subunit IIA [Nigerium massiliense]